MKISISENVKNLLFVLVELPIIYLVYFISGNNPDVLFWANMLLMLQIVARCQFSFLSLVSIISNYVLISLFIKVGGATDVYGVLGLVKSVNYAECMDYNIWFNIVLYAFCCFSNYLEKEKKLLKNEFVLNKTTVHLFCLGAIACAYIAFPQMPFSFGAGRFQALLPGSFWNHFSVIFLIFLLPMFRKKREVQFTYLFCVFWFLSHYERVDIIGLLAGIMVYVAIRKNISINSKTILKYGVIVLVVMMLMIYLGEARVGSGIENFTILVQKILNQNTASDIAYVYHSSVEYVEQYGLLNGQTFMAYIQNLVPLADADWRAGEIIRQIYRTPGGEFILSEALMNFGKIGVIVIPALYLFILDRIVSKQKLYRFLLYLFISSCSFRILWYGLIYIETGVVFLLPIVYWMTKLLNKKVRLKEV